MSYACAVTRRFAKGELAASSESVESRCSCDGETAQPQRQIPPLALLSLPLSPAQSQHTPAHWAHYSDSATRVHSTFDSFPTQLSHYSSLCRLVSEPGEGGKGGGGLSVWYGPVGLGFCPWTGLGPVLTVEFSMHAPTLYSALLGSSVMQNLWKEKGAAGHGREYFQLPISDFRSYSPRKVL